MDLHGPFKSSDVDRRMLAGEKFFVVLREDEPSTLIRFVIDPDGGLVKEMQVPGNPAHTGHLNDQEIAAVMVRARQAGYDGPDPITYTEAMAKRRESWRDFRDSFPEGTRFTSSGQPFVAPPENKITPVGHFGLLWMGMSWICMPAVLYFLLVKKDLLLAAPFMGLTVLFKLLQMRSRR